MERSDLLKGGLLIAAMVVIPGTIARLLVEVGPGDVIIFGFGTVAVTVSMVVFFALYLFAVVLVWYRFVRPLDISGPTDRDTPDEVESRGPDT